MRRAAALAKSGSERCRGGVSRGREIPAQLSRRKLSLGSRSPALYECEVSLWRKTWVFPRPRAHMHAQEASERADTHTCHTRKQARHPPESLRGLPRAHDHIISRALLSMACRGSTLVRGTRAKLQPAMQQGCSCSRVRTTCAFPNPRQWEIDYPGAAETPRARAPSSSSRLWCRRALTQKS